MKSNVHPDCGVDLAVGGVGVVRALKRLLEVHVSGDLVHSPTVTELANCKAGNNAHAHTHTHTHTHAHAHTHTHTRAHARTHSIQVVKQVDCDMCRFSR